MWPRFHCQPKNLTRIIPLANSFQSDNTYYAIEDCIFLNNNLIQWQ